MKMKQLFIPMMFIGTCLVGTTSTSAAIISFSEPLTGTAAIAVTTDIVGAATTASAENARLSVGDVSGSPHSASKKGDG